MARTLSESELKSWMARLGPRMIILSTGICRDRHRAEEIVQEAFIKLWRQPPDAGEVAYTSWVRRVVTNLSINTLQRTKRPAALPEGSTDASLATRSRRDGEADPSDELLQVRQAMDQLEPAKRAVLMLRAREQLSYEQIAEHLQVPVGTVMSRLNRARRALVDELKKIQRERDGDGDEQPTTFEFRKYLSG